MSATGPQRAAILLAAGLSTRFGGAKLLADYRGKALWRHAFDALREVSALDRLVLVVNPAFPQEAIPAFERLCVVVNPNPQEGMASSLRLGVGSCPADTATYLFALADMPALTSRHHAELLRAFDARPAGKDILRPVSEATGAAGHPVLLGACHRAALLALEGDAGARGFLEQHPSSLLRHPVSGDAWLRDVDTRADLEAP